MPGRTKPAYLQKPAAVAKLQEVQERIAETERNLIDALRRRRLSDMKIRELRIRNEDAAILGIEGDYEEMRRVQEEWAEQNLETAHLELRLAILRDEEAKAETRLLLVEEQTLKPQIPELREVLRQIGGDKVADMRNLGGEIGQLVAQVLMCTDRRAQLEQANDSRKDLIAAKRQRLEALMEGRPDPGSTTRLDSKGRLVDTSVHTGW